jgi:hypothetical protein
MSRSHFSQNNRIASLHKILFVEHADSRRLFPICPFQLLRFAGGFRAQNRGFVGLGVLEESSIQSISDQISKPTRHKKPLKRSNP